MISSLGIAYNLLDIDKIERFASPSVIFKFEYLIKKDFHNNTSK